MPFVHISHRDPAKEDLRKYKMLKLQGKFGPDARKQLDKKDTLKNFFIIGTIAGLMIGGPLGSLVGMVVGILMAVVINALRDA